MSVLIKGMDMPKSCFDCHLFKNDECILIDYEDKDICDYGDMDLSQTGICPIIGELPEKHGRLIDADELLKQFHYGEKDADIDKAWTATIRRAIKQAPTVIKSEG